MFSLDLIVTAINNFVVVVFLIVKARFTGVTDGLLYNYFAFSAVSINTE